MRSCPNDISGVQKHNPLRRAVWSPTRLRCPSTAWGRCLVPMVLLITLLLPANLNAQWLMETHGWITLEDYVHGPELDPDFRRSQRSEFTGIIDLYRWRMVTATMLIGTTTDMSQWDTGGYFLDHVTYSYTYGARIDLQRWVIRADYHHDCIHLLNRPELDGSIWWNAFQVKAGSRGSFYLYVSDDYGLVDNGFIGDVDSRIGFSAYRKAGRSLQTGQNHNYQYEFSNLTRFNLAKLDRFIAFADQTNRLWITWDGEQEYKGELTLNLMYKGEKQYLGIYYEYHLPDSYEKDREDRLGSVGMRILF